MEKDQGIDEAQLERVDSRKRRSLETTAGSWKLEAGSGKLEAGSWKLEADTQFEQSIRTKVCIMFA